MPKFCNILTKFRWNFAVICPEKMHQRPGVPRSFPGVFQEFSRSFPGVFQDLQLTEIAPNLQFPELANNCARPAAALRDLRRHVEVRVELGVGIGAQGRAHEGLAEPTRVLELILLDLNTTRTRTVQPSAHRRESLNRSSRSNHE